VAITQIHLTGRMIGVEYRDVYGDMLGASEMWLLWVP
jgi:hypothetical protein